MNINLPALSAGLAATVGVFAHGIFGHRWLVAQLRSVEMQPTPLSRSLFGDRDVSWQVLSVTWHSVTAVFLASAAALFLTGVGALESRDLLRFIAIVHLAILSLGLFYADKRLDALAQPIPLAFAVVMVAAASLAWVASSSV